MLAAIREYIAHQHMVTENQLVLQFNLEQSALSPMIELLIQRQEIQIIESDACKKQCQDCESPIYYEWIGS
jgi:hypothetical protein